MIRGILHPRRLLVLLVGLDLDFPGDFVRLLGLLGGEPLRRVLFDRAAFRGGFLAFEEHRSCITVNGR